MSLASCCVCKQELSDGSLKNIFKDDLQLQLNPDENKITNEGQTTLKIHLGIELMTGQKIIETSQTLHSLCLSCFKKLETFVNFRAQVLSSFGLLLNNGQDNVSPPKLNGLQINSQPQQPTKNNDLDYYANETLDCPKVPDCQLNSDDLINVDENSTSLSSCTVRNDEEEVNDVSYVRLQNDQENNNFNDSESSNENIDIQNGRDSPVKMQDNDIESEIDVCSGDDDEVLEMKDHGRIQRITEVDSSSESEIDVCDYEPTGKKVKNLSSISQFVEF